VRVPERGTGRRLLEIASQNAEAALVRALSARQRREGTLLALEDLQALAGLEQMPQRIEGYDISNIQGDHATASMVVFSQGQPDKASYRRFRLRSPGPDDYAMLAEALRRRLQRLAEEDPKFLPAPDLILVDGGLGQVSTVARVLAEAGLPDLPLLGLAKQEEQVFAAGEANPLPASEHQSAWYLLQRVRDEAHRFARSYHLGLRDAAMTRSELDAVPGLGPRRRQALMRAFPSLSEMARASEAELAAVPAMNATVARALQAHLAEWGTEKK
jgi:excinuclease ABC subunit C